MLRHPALCTLSAVSNDDELSAVVCAACFSNGTEKPSVAVVAVSRILDSRDSFRQPTPPSFRCRHCHCAVFTDRDRATHCSREGRVATEHRAPRGNTVTTRDRRRRNFLLYIYENPPRPSTATIERVMASKMPKKRARIDAAAAKDSTSSPSAADVGPSRCPPSQPSDATAHPKVRRQGRN